MTQPFWRRENLVTDDPQRPRAKAGRAPDVFVPGGWVPMREYSVEEEIDFAIVGTGAGGGTLACRLAEAGFSVEIGRASRRERVCQYVSVSVVAVLLQTKTP